MSRRIPPTLTREQLGQALVGLAEFKHPIARRFYTRITLAYGSRLDRDYITLLQLSPTERKLLHKVLGPGVLKSYRYIATYRAIYTKERITSSGETEQVTHTKEVVVKTNTRPTKHRAFAVQGHGTRKFSVVSVIDTHKQESNAIMARKKSTGGSKNAKAPEAEEVEEIEGLEDVEDLEDLEDVDVEEPETEDEEDNDEESLEDLPLKELRKRAKESGVPGASKMKKDELIAHLSTDEEDDEDEEEDDDDGLDELDRAGLKKILKSELGRNAKKSESDDDLRTAIREARGEEDDEEDDEDEEEPEEEKPAPKKKSGRKPPTPPNRELPKGKVGAARIAELSGKDAREVRVFLRKLGDEAEKYKVDGRWAFTEKQAAALAAKVKKAS